MAKKIFYGSVGLLIMALIFLGAYNFAFKHNVNDPVADREKKIAFEQSSDAALFPQGNVLSPLNEEIMSAVAGTDGNIYYYSLDDRSLKRASLEGKNKTVLLSNLPGTPLRIVWSSKRDLALLYLKQMSGGNNWYFSDIAKKTIVPLKPEISRLAWDNLGEKIYYQYTDTTTNTRTLNISNPDGSNWKKLADLGNRDVYIAPVPQSSMISFWNKPLASDGSSFESVSSTGEYRKTIFSGKYGADFLWSPSGETALFSGGTEKNSHLSSLYVLTAKDGQTRDLGVPTLISKAVWAKDSKTVYYALPGALPNDAILPNDYFAKPFYTKDTFWKLDTETGKKTRLIDLSESSQNFDSIDLFLSPNEDALFFTDRKLGKLHRIDL